MLLVVLRSLFFVTVIIGYSAGVWRMINDYFRREMKTFIDEEVKKNKYLLEDPVRVEVPPAVVGEHNPDKTPKIVTSNQMLDELILNFGRLFTTRNEQDLPSKKQQTHQTLPPTIPNQFSSQIAPSGGDSESKPQGQQIESSPPTPSPKPAEPPDDPLGGAKPKTIIESDEFSRSSTTTTMIAAADSGDVEEEWIRYWENRRQVGVWGGSEEEEQCQGSVIDSCELNREQPVPGS